MLNILCVFSDGRRYSFTFRHCKPLIIQDSCSWPYDKTYDTQSSAPSCDIFNLGFVIFPCPTHYRASSFNCHIVTS